ncbi:hypothetical protein TWF481_003164 [Arthrobotrys musiformis]|uniref:Uncharacterized protein n=1 Tax=Arthrobotrys musiformis TaxID=47236 RepID=A0AAV9VPF4_9PEZI
MPKRHPTTPTWHHLLPLLLTLPTPTKSYYVMTSRVNRPVWFKSWNLIMDARSLTHHLPNTCYATNRKFGDGDIEAFTVRNNEAEPPVFGIALYQSPDCGAGLGKPGYHFNKLPFMVIKFDAFDPYGINLVNLKELGVRWLAGSWISIDPMKEHEEGGLLAGIPNDGEDGVVIWEADPEYRRTPIRRVWIPNVVHKIAEGRPFFELLPPSPDRKPYVYLRDLIERFLIPNSDEIPDVVTPYFDKILSNFWGKARKPLLKGPLRNPDDPKSDFTYEGHYKEKYVPTYDPAAIEFPIIDPEVKPGVVYYDDLPGQDRMVLGQSEAIYNLQRMKHDSDMLYKEAIAEGAAERASDSLVEDNGLNDDFQKFLSEESQGEEPRDSK